MTDCVTAASRRLRHAVVYMTAGVSPARAIFICCKRVSVRTHFLYFTVSGTYVLKK